MQSGFIFGIIGSVLLLIGVFVPLVTFPLYGGISLFQVQQPVAIALLLLSAAHLVFCINRLAWGLYITKIGVLLAIAFGIFRGWDHLAGSGNFITNLLRPMVKIHWGTGLLAAGILIVMAAAVPRSKPKPKTAPPPQLVELPKPTEE